MLVKTPEVEASFRLQQVAAERALLFTVLQERKLSVKERVRQMEKNLRALEEVKAANKVSDEHTDQYFNLAVSTSDILIASLYGVQESTPSYAASMYPVAEFDPSWATILQESGFQSPQGSKNLARQVSTLNTPPPEAPKVEELEATKKNRVRRKRPRFKNVASKIRRSMHQSKKKRRSKKVNADLFASQDEKVGGKEKKENRSKRKTRRRLGRKSASNKPPVSVEDVFGTKFETSGSSRHFEMSMMEAQNCLAAPAAHIGTHEAQVGEPAIDENQRKGANEVPTVLEPNVQSSGKKGSSAAEFERFAYYFHGDSSRNSSKRTGSTSSSCTSRTTSNFEISTSGRKLRGATKKRSIRSMKRLHLSSFKSHASAVSECSEFTVQEEDCEDDEDSVEVDIEEIDEKRSHDQDFDAPSILRKQIDNVETFATF